MANIASVSQAKISNRRQQLKRARRIKFFQALWRSLLVSGIASGLIWTMTLPDWVIRQPEQIDIEGNEFLSTQAIRELLPLTYPQALWRVEPQAIAEAIEEAAPIATATVTRKLMPPGLTIQVQERYPVAIARGKPSTVSGQTQATAVSGFLDERGVWMPQNSYRSLKADVELPTLEVWGDPASYRTYWPQVYQLVNHSPVKVLEIDWRNPANLILKTELGQVHLGANLSDLAEQLNVLDRMRQLSTHLRPNEIHYIDLQNPDRPVIQMKESNQISEPAQD